MPSTHTRTCSHASRFFLYTTVKDGTRLSEYTYHRMMSRSVRTYFLFPLIGTLFLFLGTWVGFGTEALLLVVILSILEVTFSFDNAVVNARVLERMTPVWQARFLTWGIPLAVFGTRFILPIVIVSVAAGESPLAITALAFNDPAAYGDLLHGAHSTITAFGGMFLLMVSLKYFCNHAKSVHWIRSIERNLAKWGRIEAIEIAIALLTLIAFAYVTHYDKASVLSAGIIGLVLFVLMEGIANSLTVDPNGIAKGGAALFIYLNILDTAFSLDGVIGAFALTTNIFIIMIGLGIGAYFVRSMTIYFVREKTLSELIYLEHGAHWAILGLALTMIAELVIEVPELITGTIGLVVILFAYQSSQRELKNG